MGGIPFSSINEQLNMQLSQLIKFWNSQIRQNFALFRNEASYEKNVRDTFSVKLSTYSKADRIIYFANSVTYFFAYVSLITELHPGNNNQCENV